MSYDLGQTVDGRCKSPLCTCHDGDYRIPSACTNCSWQGRIVLTRGHTVRHALISLPCPHCGCRDLMQTRSAA